MGHNDVVMELCKQGALIDIPDKVCKLLQLYQIAFMDGFLMFWI